MYLNEKDKELIKLLKPCEKMCEDCGAKCCYNLKDGKPCERLLNGKCTDRNLLCLLHTCSQMREKFPEICKKLKERKDKIFPYATSLGIELNLNCQGL